MNVYKAETSSPLTGRKNTRTLGLFIFRTTGIADHNGCSIVPALQHEGCPPWELVNAKGTSTHICYHSKTKPLLLCGTVETPC